MSVIHWFRRDLRLQDNTALHAALKSGQPVVPLFILDDELMHSPRAGAPRVAFLLQTLRSLDTSLRALGSRLLIRRGAPQTVLQTLIADVNAQAVYFNADYSPYARRRDSLVEKSLSIPVYDFDDVALVSPNHLYNKQGKPYTVFTPYRNAWNTCHKADLSLLTLKAEMFHPLRNLEGEDLPSAEALGLGTDVPLPPADEASAQARLEAFAQHDLMAYGVTRNMLTIQPFASVRATGPSYLSPYLRLGLLSPRQPYHAARAAYVRAKTSAERESVEAWVGELAWRDFYIQVLYHFPHVLRRDFKPQYEALAWENNAALLRAWQEGRTGYPIVDAPMRQLNAIGWMPNRARMIVASFLTKDLLIHWTYGDLYFMQRLLDGDPAANNGGWQWAAGTGTDAQPFYRIFNPVTQSEKFATPGYLRHWLPELRTVPDDKIHAPWLMNNPPRDYPRPIVDHAQARERTLKVFSKLRIANKTTGDEL